MDYSCSVHNNGVIHLLKESTCPLTLSTGIPPLVPSSTSTPTLPGPSSTSTDIPTVPLSTTGNVTTATAYIVIQNYLLNKSVDP